MLFLHRSLDGFIAGPHGKMDWAVNTDEMIEYIYEK